jgi:hypothetical protein
MESGFGIFSASRQYIPAQLKIVVGMICQCLLLVSYSHTGKDQNARR